YTLLVIFKLEMVAKFVWLKTLKTSHRSWSDFDSLKLMLFERVASKRVVGGPLIVFRPALPTRLTPAGGLAKQAVLNHCKSVCGAFAFGSHIMSGLAPEGDDPRKPIPAGSLEEVAGENPKPV